MLWYLNSVLAITFHLTIFCLWEWWSADITEVDHYANVPLVVNASGYVFWVPPAIFKSECPMDLTYWPYDTQTCHLFFGSWTSHGWQVNLELESNSSEVGISFFVTYTDYFLE